MFWAIPFELLTCFIADKIEKRASAKAQACEEINKCLKDFLADLGIESESNSKSKPKAKYRMKEIENEGELFFTDAADFNEAFKL